jgi:protoporphyrinogen oxidase
MRTAVCKWCGKTFKYAKTRGTKSFCCAECRGASQAEGQRQRDKENRERRRYMQSLSKGTNTELKKLAKEAIAHGTTYGKYVAVLEKKKGAATA